jgi:hypothetical protein
MTLTVTMTAPIAWDHHYGVMLPMYAVAVPHLLTRRPLGVLTIPALVASYLLSSNFLQFTTRFDGTGFAILESYLLGGALILLLLLYSDLRTADPSTSGGTPEKDSPACGVRSADTT